MAILVERTDRTGQPVRSVPVREERRAPRTVDRTRPPTRPKRVTAPRIVAAPRLPRPKPLPLVFLLLIGAFVCAAVYGLGALSGSVAGDSVPSHTVSVVVAPGENLWSIAGRHAPDSAPAAVVDRIRDLNDLDVGDVVPVGTPLMVPDGH
jgi:LysM domain-containing protein